MGPIDAIFNVAEMGALTEAYAQMYRCPYPRCTPYPIKYIKIHLKYISYTQGIGASVHRPPVRGVDVYFRNEAPMLNDRPKRYFYILTTNLAECVCVCAKCDPFLPLRFHFFFKLPEFFFRIAKFPYAAFGPLFVFHCPIFFTKNNTLNGVCILNVTAAHWNNICYWGDYAIVSLRHLDSR